MNVKKIVIQYISCLIPSKKARKVFRDKYNENVIIAGIPAKVIKENIN